MFQFTVAREATEVLESIKSNCELFQFTVAREATANLSNVSLSIFSVSIHGRA